MLWPTPSIEIKVWAMSPTLRRERVRSQDVRNRRIVLLAHCLLNQNTRYPGGAVCPGAVRGVIEPYLDAGVGLVQLPCPEQRTWGGVEKRALLWFIDHPRAARAAAVLSRPLTALLRVRYRRIARPAVRDIADYLDGGFDITDIVGVAESPSCGVETTLDIPCALRAIGATPRTDADWFDRAVVDTSTVTGPGLFMEALAAELRKRGTAIPMREVLLRDASAGP